MVLINHQNLTCEIKIILLKNEISGKMLQLNVLKKKDNLRIEAYNLSFTIQVKNVICNDPIKKVTPEDL